MKLLFICSQNKLRSPTAETIFSEYYSIECRSAGLNNNAIVKIGSDDIEWADIIFVMEQKHKIKLMDKYKSLIKNKKIVVLSIPDKYKYMHPDLIKLLIQKVKRYLK